MFPEDAVPLPALPFAVVPEDASLPAAVFAAVDVLFPADAVPLLALPFAVLPDDMLLPLPVAVALPDDVLLPRR